MTDNTEPLACGCTPYTGKRCAEAQRLWKEHSRRHGDWRLVSDVYRASGCADDRILRTVNYAEFAREQAWQDYVSHLHPDDPPEIIYLRRDLDRDGWSDHDGLTNWQRAMLEGTPFEVPRP